MSSYVNPVEDLYGDGENENFEIQTQFYIRHTTCEFPGCFIELFWYDAGAEDATACFEPLDTTCTCAKEYPVLCCTKHKYMYKCDQCESSEEKQPDVTAKRARIFDLEQELELLKSELVEKESHK